MLRLPQRTERAVLVPSAAAAAGPARGAEEESGEGAGAGAGRGAGAGSGAGACLGPPRREAQLRAAGEARALGRAVAAEAVTREGWSPWPAPGAGGAPPVLSAAVLRHRRCAAPCRL